MHERQQPPRRHSHTARRTLATLTAGALLALPAIALATSAQADTCTPSDARTEQVPAVGEPTKIVDNPAFVPEVLAVYETVTHPAVYETVTHPAVYETVTHPAVYETVTHPAVTEIVTHPAVTETRTQPVQRYAWHPGGQVPEGQTPAVTGSTPLTRPGEWTGNTTSYNGTDPLGVAFSVGGDGVNGSWFFWTTTKVDVVITPAWNEEVVKPAWDEEVLVTAAWDEEVLVTAAWDEDVLVTAAWDEEVLVTPYAPAQGDPTIEVENPDYVPGYQIEHPAVVCTTVAATSTPTADVLAETGSDIRTGALVAAVVVLLGATLAVVSHRRTGHQH